MKGFYLFISALSDLLVRHLPQHRTKNGFAFLVHPRDIPDVYRKYPMFKYFSKNFTESFLLHFWPVTLSKITGVYDSNNNGIPGWIISIPITAEQMMRDKELALRFIIKASKLAEKKGAKIIGLGALTASLTNGGKKILPYIDSCITTGRLYTSKIIADTAEASISKLSLKKDLTIAIVGAAGSIGTASTQILAERGFSNFILIDLSQKSERINSLKDKILSINENNKVSISDNIELVHSADLIIAVTNKPEALIRSKFVKPGTIIIDDAQPSDIDDEIIKNREDVIVLEGGLVKAEKINTNFNMGLHFKNNIYSCLAESIILSLAEHNGHFQVGEMFEIDKKMIEKLEFYEKKFGFTLAEFQNKEKIYTEDDFKRIRSIIK